MIIFAKSILVYLLFLATALAFRAAFLLAHTGEGYSLAQALRSLASGARFDMQLLGYAAAAYYLLALLRWRPWQRALRALYTALGALLIAANCAFFPFYAIYGKNFDNQLFLFRNEELAPLLAAVWSESYGIVPAVLAFLAASWAFAVIFGRIHNARFARLAAWQSGLARSRKIALRAGLFAAFAFFMMLSINQQLHYKATSVYNTLRFTQFAALNASMPGHLKGFLSALRDGLVIKQRRWQDFTQLSPREAACQMLALRPCPKSFALSDVARNTNPITPLPQRPKRVFYVISESLSDWINEPRFAPLWGDFLSREGMAYAPAIENAPATARSLQAQLAGLYYNEVDNTHFAADMVKIPTNVITRARKAGYEVHFYFGGANNWAELFDFYRALDPAIKLHDKDDAMEWARAAGLSEPLANGWGAFDDVLFAYARANAAENTFNIFMTITNHPAYDLAWLARTPAAPSWEQIDAISPKYRAELATVQWYLRVLDEWLSRAQPGELYLITGDHYGRYNVDDSHDAALTHAVPVYAYAPGQQLRPAIARCSHLGIAASIFALAGVDDDVTLAPACFSAAGGAAGAEPGAAGGAAGAGGAGIPAPSENPIFSQNLPQLDVYGYEYSYRAGELVPTPPEAAALGWYLSYVGEHFDE